MFSMFVTMSRPSSIHAVYMWYIFSFSPSLKETHLFLIYFLEYFPLFLDDSLDKESE